MDSIDEPDWSPKDAQRHRRLPFVLGEDFEDEPGPAEDPEWTPQDWEKSPRRRHVPSYVIEDSDASSSSEEDLVFPARPGPRRSVIEDEKEDEESDSSDGEGEEEETDEGFVCRLLGMDHGRRMEEFAAMLGSAFTGRPDGPRSAAAIMSSLRDFAVLARHGEEGVVLTEAAERDPACAATAAAFEGHAGALHRLVRKCGDTLVEQFHGMRPLAFDLGATARAFLWYAAHAMPACLRPALFRQAPAELRHGLAQAAEVAGGGMVVAACVAQLERLLEADASAPADAGFLLHNVAGAVDRLMADAGGPSLATRLAELRAADRERERDGKREKRTARFGRKMFVRVDPPQDGADKVVVRHERRLPNLPRGDEGRKSFRTSLVHHVPVALRGADADAVLACFRESHDPRVRAYLDEWAPVDVGFSHTTGTGVRIMTMWSGATLGLAGTTAEGRRGLTRVVATHARRLSPHHRLYTRLVVFLTPAEAAGDAALGLARFRASPDARVARFLEDNPGLALSRRSDRVYALE